MHENREEYRHQAAVLDLIAARVKYAGNPDWFFSRFLAHLSDQGVSSVRVDPYLAFSRAGKDIFGLDVPADWIRDYIQTLRRQTPNAAIGGFLRRMHEDPQLRKAFLSAARDHDSLQRVSAANGLDVTADDLKYYLDPWQIFASLLDRLRKLGTISATEFEDKASFPPDEPDRPDFGSDVDRALLMAALSASGWVVRLRNISTLSVPIGCLVFPTAAVIIGGYEGQTFSFHELGDMFKDTFQNALSGIADVLENFHSTVGGFFD